MKAGLLSKALSNAGVTMSESKTKLWGEPEMIDLVLKPKDIEVRKSEYEDGEGLYIILRDGKLSRLVPFAPGELEDIDIDDLDTDDDGIVTNWKNTVQVGIVTAGRDDEDLSFHDLDNVKHDSISEGDQALRAFLQ